MEHDSSLEPHTFSATAARAWPNSWNAPLTAMVRKRYPMWLHGTDTPGMMGVMMSVGESVATTKLDELGSREYMKTRVWV